MKSVQSMKGINYGLKVERSPEELVNLILKLGGPAMTTATAAATGAVTSPQAQAAPAPLLEAPAPDDAPPPPPPALIEAPDEESQILEKWVTYARDVEPFRTRGTQREAQDAVKKKVALIMQNTDTEELVGRFGISPARTKANDKERRLELVKRLFKFDTPNADTKRVRAMRTSANQAVTSYMKQYGNGYEGADEGLYSHEVNQLARGIKGYCGCYSSNEIQDITPPKRGPYSFVMNLDPLEKPGSHWVSCWVDPHKRKEIAYFDSFGEPPTNDFMQRMKTLTDKVDVPYLLKTKHNEVKHQGDDTGYCGQHAVNYLRERANGVSHARASHYPRTKKTDISAKQDVKMANFGYQ